MKKIILSMFAIGMILSSCGNNGKKAETKEAEKVSVEKTQQTTTLKAFGKESYIDWRASHLGGAQPRYGKVFIKDVTFLVNDGILSNATIELDLASLTVESFPEGSEQIAKLEGHLKSPDFFNIEQHPTSIFELTQLQETTGPFNSKITGNLTISGITKSITFNANVDVSENKVSIKSEDFSIDRADWNLTYNAEGTKGVPVDYLIANDIGFTINVSAAK
jgi:polyisoprenoid-binding protein YceI